MTKVIIDEDCGNSPKNIFVTEVVTAFAKSDAKYLLRHVTEDVRWMIVGQRVIEGKAQLAEALKEMKAEKVATLTIKHVATHGKAGAVDGTIQLANGQMRAFCDVYEFGNAKGENVKAITSYVIEIK